MQPGLQHPKPGSGWATHPRLAACLQLIAPSNGQLWTFDTLGPDCAEITYFIFGYMNTLMLMIGGWD